jgi:hypothetical protein
MEIQGYTNYKDVKILGSYKNPVYKSKGKYYRKVVLSTPSTWDLQDLDQITEWLEKVKKLSEGYVAVSFEMSIEESYGDHCIQMVLSGFKELTEEELSEYKDTLKKLKDQERKNKEAQFEQLKKELGK